MEIMYRTAAGWGGVRYRSITRSIRMRDAPVERGARKGPCMCLIFGRWSAGNSKDTQCGLRRGSRGWSLDLMG